MKGYRLAGVVFAVVSALLIVSAPIAAQSAGLVVVSQHTTGSDFSSGDLTDLSMVGSSSSAFVATRHYQWNNQSDTDLSVDGSSSISVGGDYPAAGPGSNNLPVVEVTGSRSVTPGPSAANDNSEDYYWEDAPEEITELAGTVGDSSVASDRYVAVYIAEGDQTGDSDYTEGTRVCYEKTPVGRSGERDFSCNVSENFDTSNGVTINIELDTGLTYARMDIQEMYSGYPDNVQVDAGGETASVGDVGDGTASTEVEIPPTATALDFSGSQGKLDYTLRMQNTLSGGDGTYISQTHDVSNAEQLSANLTLENTGATIAVDEYDGGSWSEVSSKQVSSSGNHTLDVSGATQDTLRTRVELSETTGDSIGELHDESILFTPRSPTIDEESASPTGGVILNQSNIQLSAPVSDPDFGTSQGDEVTVDIYMNGSQVDTQTITSNQTVTTTVEGVSGGSHSWNYTTRDSYGLEEKSSNFGFATPDTLYIYNESSPDELVKNESSPMEITVQFIAGGDVYQRTTTDGTVDFSGLPTDKEFVVRVSADGYENRRVYVSSLIEQQSVYMLPTSADSANVVFSLDDKTGQFTPAEQTTLFVEKAINKSGDTRYRTIVSDQFSGTGQVPVTLENNDRYRLRVESPQGQQRVLGAYTTAGADNPTLTIGQISYAGSNATSPSFASAVVEEDGNRALRIAYRDPAKQTNSLDIEVYNMDNESEFLRENTTEVGPHGVYIETIPLSGEPEGESYVVRYHANRDGEDTGGTEFVGDVPKIAQDLGLDPQVLSLLGYISIFATLGLVAIASPRFAGVPAFAVATGLTAIGAVAIHPLLLAGGGVTAVLFAAGGGR